MVKDLHFQISTVELEFIFEQGSSRGHIQESDNGLLTFAFTIRNQFVTALSTLEAHQVSHRLLHYQRDFYKNVRTNNAKNKNQSLCVW